MRAAPTARRSVFGALLRLGRVSNLPTVWTNVLAATALAGGTSMSRCTAALLAAMTMFYVGGMVLNDAFDRAIDGRERQSRPIPAGEIPAAAAFAGGFACLGVGVVVMATNGLGAGLAGLVLACTIVAYDLHHKKNPFSPVVMGLCRALVFVGTGLAVRGQLTWIVLMGAACSFAHVIGLTYAAKQESLDRVARLWPLAALALPLTITLPAVAADPFAVLPWLALSAANALAVVALVRRASPGAVPRAVATLIAAISLLDGLLAAWSGAWITSMACLGGYMLTRGLHRVIPGT